MSKERIPYWQKLKDPRWQMKRLELMKERGLTCEHCKAEGKTLDIHHKVYHRNTDPWDYEDWAYSVLCEDCHKTEQAIMAAAHDAIAKFPDLMHACAIASTRKSARRFAQAAYTLAGENEKLLDLIELADCIQRNAFTEGQEEAWNET